MYGGYDEEEGPDDVYEEEVLAALSPYKLAVVTGGNRGVGLEIVRLLCRIPRMRVVRGVLWMAMRVVDEAYHLRAAALLFCRPCTAGWTDVSEILMKLDACVCRCCAVATRRRALQRSSR
jgi:hypothetical protein